MNYIKLNLVKNISYLNYIREIFPKYIKSLNILTYNNLWNINYHELIIKGITSNIYNIIYILKNHNLFYFNSLVELSTMDNPTKIKRLELNYIMLSYFYNTRIRVKINFIENYWVDSIISIFKGANWLEREAWDMMGIFFKKHNDLRRILTDYGFKYFPLRKDFPLFGYIEIKYNNYLNKLIFVPVELSQEFRIYEFKSPWENTK